MIKFIILALILLGCSAKSTPVESSNNEGIDKAVWQKPNLKGHWKMVHSERVKDIPFVNLYHNTDEMEMAVEHGPFEYYRSSDMFIDNDSIYWVDYPMEILRKMNYHLDSGYSIGANNGYNFGYPTEQIGDTLFMYIPGSYGPEYLKEAFVKTTFNDSILNLLKKHRVNYPELEGWWYLMRDYTYDYGTNYRLNYDYKIPDSIKISRETFLNTQNDTKTIMMMTDGKNREYTYSYDYQYLHLIPGDWYTGEDPWIHFEETNNYY